MQRTWIGGGLAGCMRMLCCCKGQCDTQRCRLERSQMFLVQILWAPLESLELSSNGKVLSVGTLKLFKQWLESCCPGMHGHLALHIDLHLLVRIKAVGSTQRPQIFLRQGGNTLPRMNSQLFLVSFYHVSDFPSSFELRFRLIGIYFWLYPRMWFSAVSREWLAYLMSGLVLDISVVWNCLSRSKNGVCTIVNLMTEWRNKISFIGEVFFLLDEGPKWKDIGVILPLWTGAYNWKMYYFIHLEKAGFWYGLEREYD